MHLRAPSNARNFLEAEKLLLASEEEISCFIAFFELLNFIYTFNALTAKFGICSTVLYKIIIYICLIHTQTQAGLKIKSPRDKAMNPRH
jgi:hypothetical protein